MMRVTARKCNGAVVLKIEGWLQGHYVEELRRYWQEIQAAGGVIVELADVRFVDRRGKALLAAMYSRGVRIRAGDPLCAALRDEIVARCGGPRRLARDTD
jgi:anti-anti-sigma regulatory factor